MRREEVIQYVYERFGRTHAAQVANVISYRPRSAVRDAARALGHDVGQQDAWSKSIERWGRCADRTRRARGRPQDPRPGHRPARGARGTGGDRQCCPGRPAAPAAPPPRPLAPRAASSRAPSSLAPQPRTRAWPRSGDGRAAAAPVAPPSGPAPCRSPGLDPGPVGPSRRPLAHDDNDRRDDPRCAPTTRTTSCPPVARRLPRRRARSPARSSSLPSAC
ncbi:hypothetical protein NKG05_29545 [Oerskovia sp. M15]